MTREEVKVVFTGVAHDHLMASNKLHPVRQTHQYESTYQINNNNKSNDDQRRQPHHHHHHHIHHHQHQNQMSNQLSCSHHQHQQHQCHQLPQHINDASPSDQHHVQPLGGCLTENLRPRHQEQNPPKDITATNCTSPLMLSPEQLNSKPSDNASALSTIAILRRLTMYDSLVLVKKYRPCLSGYSLEFPTSNESSHYNVATSEENKGQESAKRRPETANEISENSHANNSSLSSCGRTKLVSVYLDGDDPIYQCQQNRLSQQNGAAATGQSESHDGEIVYVPVNGLMDRLENYDRNGIAIDSRVYAFAMGLKTAERFMSSSTEKEIQEAPPF